MEKTGPNKNLIKEYNGWASYETWNVMLLLNNDKATYDGYREMTRNFIKNQGRGNFLCKNVRYIVGVLLGTMTIDGVLLSSKNIKWSEIRSAMLESVKES